MRIEGLQWKTSDSNIVAIDPRERLSRTIASSVASVSLSVPPEGLRAVLKNINASGTDVGFWMRCSVDGGATFDSTANYSNSAGYITATSEAVIFNTGTNQVQFLQDASSNATLGGNLSGFIWMRTITTPVTFNYQFTYLGEDAVFRNCRGVGRYQGTGPVTHVQFLMELGNIESGEFLAYRMFSR